MENKPFHKNAWAEIDIGAAAYNYDQIRKRLNKGTRLCCVLKGDGYGHGAAQMAKLYEKAGADYLAVSDIDEALRIRRAGVRLPVLILGYTDPRYAELLAENDLSQSVFSYEYGRRLSECAEKAGVAVAVHFKTDTGLGRIGFQCDQDSLDGIAELCSSPHLITEGIFTHFAAADEGESGREYTRCQFGRFLSSIEYLRKKGMEFPLKHCANSACIMDYPEMQLDMVRAGIALYGLLPSASIRHPLDLRPVRSLKTSVFYVRDVPAGQRIGYGREFKADRDMRIAAIPIGYANGLSESRFKNRIRIEVEGRASSIVGRACMELCMIDITDIPSAGVNSIVTISDNQGSYHSDRDDGSGNTVSYEISSSFGESNPRVYVRNGCIEEVSDGYPN